MSSKCEIPGMFLNNSLYCKVPRVGMICTSYVLWVLQKSVCRLLYDVIKASMASIAAIPLYYMNFKDLIGFLVTNRSPEAVHRKIKLQSRSIHLQSTKLWCLFKSQFKKYHHKAHCGTSKVLWHHHSKCIFDEIWNCDIFKICATFACTPES